MIYRLKNTDKDEFITFVLDEIRHDLESDDGQQGITVNEVVQEHNCTKGIEIQEIVLCVQRGWETIAPQVETVALGIASAGIYDIIKNVLKKYRKMEEYSPTKEIEIEQEDEKGNKSRIKITLEEILKK